MNKKVFSLLVLIYFFATTVVYSDQTTEIEELKKQIAILNQKVAQLEAQQSGNGYFRPSHPSTNPHGLDPFEEIDRMQEQMRQMFSNADTFKPSTPLPLKQYSFSFDQEVELKDTPEGYTITLDTKELNKDKLDVKINESSITINGEFSKEETQEEKDKQFYSKQYGSFIKTIPLPIDADTTKVKTNKEGDNLVIIIPKKK